MKIGRKSIATMREKGASIGCRDLDQGGRNRRFQGLRGAGSRTPHIGFDLCERELNWRIIRRVGWQIDQPTAAGRDNRLRTWAGMRTEVIDNDDLSWTARWNQYLFQIGGEGDLISTTADDQRRFHALMRDGGNRGGIDGRVARYPSHGTFADRSPGMAGSHVQIAANLVNHDDLRGIEIRLLQRKRDACPGIAFGSDDRLFCATTPDVGSPAPSSRC